ncbi:glycoside hydrolase family 99-like domain-containing protein [Candidatus Microgenomates bacterium]|nr:glycoside hydrolase family 99-like domain-containing protein [Candidatus Microgenomates bacterium]
MAGAERSLLELLDGLKSRGIVCYVVLPAEGILEDELKKRLIPYSISPYRFWVMDENEKKEEVEDEISSQAIELARLLDSVKPDIIYTNTSVINVGALVARMLGKPHIWHIREFGEPSYKLILPIKERSKFVHENSECVIYNSKAVKEYYDGDKDKGIVIYNNISVDSFSSDDDIKKMGRVFKNKESYKLATIGSVSVGKNQEDIIFAVRDLVREGIDIELVIAGDEESVYAEKLRKIVSDNKLENNIRFLGYIHKPYRILSETDVLVVCSKNEAFGRTVVEGMLVGKPVIATRVGGIPEIITDGINGLLYVAGDHGELSEKLKFLFNNISKADLYAINGYEFAIKNFNDDKYSGKVIEVLSDLNDFTISGFNSLWANVWKLQKRDIDKRNDEIFSLTKSIQEKDKVILLQEKYLHDKEDIIQEKDKVIILQEKYLHDKEDIIQEKDILIKNKDVELAQHIKLVHGLFISTSWRVTRPFRFISTVLKRMSLLFIKTLFRLAKRVTPALIKKIIKRWFLLFIKKIKEKHEDSSCDGSTETGDTDNLPVIYNDNSLKSVYYISSVESGGTKKYIDDLLDTFATKDMNFVRIKSRDDLFFYEKYFKESDILLFQYLLYTDIEFEDIINIKKEKSLKLVVPVHDFYFFGEKKNEFYEFSPKVHTIYSKEVLSFSPLVFELLNLADIIIYPSNFVKNIFDSVYCFKTARLSGHIDNRNVNHAAISNEDAVSEKIINIGIINDAYPHKGGSYYPNLFRLYEYKGYKIFYHIFGHSKLDAPNVIFHGPYREDEIYSLLQENEIHGLVFLNEYAETYSYSLTKGINTRLPVLYSKIGAYTERMRDKTNSFPLGDIASIQTEACKMFDLIINNQCHAFGNSDMVLEKDIPNLYQELFLVDYDKMLDDKYHKNKKYYDYLFKIVEPYAIYFPQFHALKENNRTFYEGYHDMVNLQQAKKEDSSLETPIKNYLGYYNLKNDPSIIERQILLAKTHGFKGFGIYYYWFSHNSITGNDMLMKDVVDKFFEDNFDSFDVFFIYANESWSDNPAFNQYTNGCLITNKYSKEEIIKNFENLVPYFRHPNYKKIDNKPVFLIHHPHEMTDSEIRLFVSVGDEIVKSNGFSGLELIINEIKGGRHFGITNYSHHPDYKDTTTPVAVENGIRYIDYQKYVDDYFPNTPSRFRNIQTVFYNFDNTVRYFNHKNKQILVTKTKNNNIEYFKKFLISSLNTYKHRDKSQKIFLMNSWNEWGEQMALEPSSESGFRLLDAFCEVILDFAKEDNHKDTND